MRVKENSLFQKGLRIIINWDLFRKILYGKFEKPEKKELKVEAIDGIPDGILGVFNPKENKIYTDIGEIGIFSFLAGKTKQGVDDEVTKALAHEAEHAIQFSKLGYMAFIDKFIIIILLTAMSIGSLSGALVIGTHFMEYFHHLVGINVTILSAILYYLGYVIFIIRPFVSFLNKFFGLLKFLAYKYCWSERDARKFAQAALKDSDWQNVVKIE